MENKKIANATEVSYKDLKFKSKLERYCFLQLTKEGFKPEYETFKMTLFKGFRPEHIINIDNFDRKKKKSYNKYEIVICDDIMINNNIIRDITYTPDFTFIYKDYFIIIETKGFSNDSYPNKKKYALKQLEEKAKDTGEKIIFIEIRNQTQVREIIKYLKTL